MIAVPKKTQDREGTEMTVTPEQDPDSPRRPGVARARRVVVKLGTRVLTDDSGELELQRVRSVVESVAGLRRQGRHVLLVSSGAVGLGRKVLGLPPTRTDAATRQACAAVGQGRLVALFEQELAVHGLLCAQLLLSEAVFDHRPRSLTLRQTLDTLLAHGVLPLLNENDAAGSVPLASIDGESRPVFEDNDGLAALIATELGADLLVLLTDVDGVYETDPRDDPAAQRLSRVDDGTALLGKIAPGAGSALGRGGMRSKVMAAEKAASCGCEAVIASGWQRRTVARVVAGDDVGTWFPARRSLDARRRWIAFATATRGALSLDDGAIEALVERDASLLPVGVHEVVGTFERGEVVELRDQEGRAIGRALSPWPASRLRGYLAGVEGRLGPIRRGRMVLYSELGKSRSQRAESSEERE